MKIKVCSWCDGTGKESLRTYAKCEVCGGSGKGNHEIEICDICSKEVMVICFKGTGVCSENCRKGRDNAN